MDECRVVETEPISLASNVEEGEEGSPIGVERHRPAAEKLAALVVPLIGVRHHGSVDMAPIVKRLQSVLMTLTRCLDKVPVKWKSISTLIILGGIFCTPTGHVHFCNDGYLDGLAVHPKADEGFRQPCLYCHKEPDDVDDVDGILAKEHKCTAVPTSTLQRLIYGPYRRTLACNIRPFKFKTKALDVDMRVVVDMIIFDGGFPPRAAAEVGTKFRDFIVEPLLAIMERRKQIKQRDSQPGETDPEKQALERVEMATEPVVGGCDDARCGVPRRRRGLADGTHLVSMAE